MNEVLDAIHELGTRLDRMDGRFDRIDTRLDGIDLRLDGIEARLGGLQSEAARTGERFDRLETRIEGLEKFVRNQPDLKLVLVRLKVLSEESRSVRMDLLMLRSAFNDFNALSVTEGEINALHEAVSKATEVSYLLAARVEILEQSAKARLQD